jgi:hypothetical protein
MTQGSVMRVRNVHTRELSAAPQDLGALIDRLGSEDDRSWPTDRGAAPLELDGPMAVGASGGHGAVRYAVVEHEPGRRVVFRFRPRVGLVGTHGFDIAPLGDHRSRITHTLECDVRPKLLPVWPIVRRAHDVLIEELFDRAERATTGRSAAPSRWPVSVRIANANELAMMRHRRNDRATSALAGGATS